MRIHLDTDLGGDTDDLCALALLLSLQDIELTGITTTNEHGGKRAGYVQYVLRMLGRAEVPLAAGAESGMAGLRYPGDLPDERAYWPEPVAACQSRPGAALDLLDASITQGATIVATGPYTNLAMLEAARPGSLARARVVLMGGYIGPMLEGLPPYGPEHDWNMHMDTLATQRVLACCQPLIVPIDVTVQTYLRGRDLPRLRGAGPLGALLARQAEAYEREYGHQALAHAHALLPGDLLNFQHDPLACAVALGWDGVSVADLRLGLALVDGYPVLCPEPDGTCYPVVRAVDAERFNQYWLDAVAP